MFYDSEDHVSAVVILNELLYNVLVLDLDIDRLIQHLLQVPNLILLHFAQLLSLLPALPHLLQFYLLLQYVVAILLSLLLKDLILFQYLLVHSLELLVFSAVPINFIPKFSVLKPELVHVVFQVIILIEDKGRHILMLQ